MAGRAERQWTIKAPDPSLVRDISGRTGLSAAAAAILVNRGITGPSDVERFLAGSLKDLTQPFLMKDLEKAALRIVAAGRRREPVLVYADYDVDGATGAACLSLFLGELFPGMPVRIHQNHRVQEGYGLKPHRLEAALAEGFRLVVTVDCGISDMEPVRAANAMGMEVIVTDHHVPGDALPQAFAILNPRQDGCGFPEKNLAGVGVVFMLMCGIRRVLRDDAGSGSDEEPGLRQYLDLVALGTVADMVPLRGDNRLFVRAGIEEIRKGPRPGMRAIFSVAGIDSGSANESDLGFRVGPRLNAAGRMGESGRSSGLLVTRSEEEAFRIARELHAENGRRQREEERILRSVEALLKERGEPSSRGAIVLSDPDWHFGVLGIVASKLVDRFYRPTVLLRVEGGEAKGSARSVDGFSLIDSLRELEPILTRYGGHAQAAGVALPAENIPLFREKFSGIAERFAAERGLVPTVHVDAQVRLSEVSRDLIRELDRLRPFGIGNAEPVLLSRNLRVTRKSVFGESGQHLRFDAVDEGRTFEVVAFNRSDVPAGPGGRIDVLFSPQESSFRGNRTIRLLLRDARPA